jgi:hypothetical protein
MVGVSVVIVAQIVLVALGDNALGLWLAAALAPALAAGATAWSRPVSPALVAQMLDRCGDLHDLLSTATEMPCEEGAASGLGALILRDARRAAHESFTTVRLTEERPRRDWSLLAVAIALLVTFAVLPVEGGHIGAQGQRAEAAAPSTGSARKRSSAAAGRAAARARRGAALAGQAPPRISRAPLAVHAEGPHQSKGSGFSPYGHGGNSLSAKQLARAGIAPAPSTKQSLGALSVGEAGGGSGHGNAGSSNSGSAAGTGGKAATGTSSKASGAGGAASSSGKGALTPAQENHADAAPTSGTKQAGAGSGAGSTGSSPPGGGAAGSSRGSEALAAGLVPALGGSTLGLPLQAGYAPSAAHGSQSGEGVSQTPNGGGHGGRSARSSSGSATSVSSQLSVIPPSFNSTATLDRGVLANYFGSSNQLTPSNW